MIQYVFNKPTFTQQRGMVVADERQVTPIKQSLQPLSAGVVQKMQQLVKAWSKKK